MSNFTFSEGVADSADFWFGKFLENITPEGFDGDLNLGDSQHGVFDGVFFFGSGVNFEVLDVASEIKFGVDPIRVADRVNVLS